MGNTVEILKNIVDGILITDVPHLETDEVDKEVFFENSCEMDRLLYRLSKGDEWFFDWIGDALAGHTRDELDAPLAELIRRIAIQKYDVRHAIDPKDDAAGCMQINDLYREIGKLVYGRVTAYMADAS